MPPGLPSLHAGILIGGRSARMGAPKAMLVLAGCTFAERVLNAVAPRAESVFLLGEGPVPNPLSQLPRLADAPDAPGPLGGILAALRAHPGYAWLIAAVDLPLITPSAIDWLIAQRRAEAAAILPTIDGRRPEPLLAIYEPAALALLEAAVRRGADAPRALAALPQARSPSVPPELAEAWTNVNTQAELRALPAIRQPGGGA